MFICVPYIDAACLLVARGVINFSRTTGRWLPAGPYFFWCSDYPLLAPKDAPKLIDKFLLIETVRLPYANTKSTQDNHCWRNKANRGDLGLIRFRIHFFHTKNFKNAHIFHPFRVICKFDKIPQWVMPKCGENYIVIYGENHQYTDERWHETPTSPLLEYAKARVLHFFSCLNGHLVLRTQYLKSNLFIWVVIQKGRRVPRGVVFEIRWVFPFLTRYWKGIIWILPYLKFSSWSRILDVATDFLLLNLKAAGRRTTKWKIILSKTSFFVP